jgi:transposase
LALGGRGPVQEPLFAAQDEIAQAPAHRFYSRLQSILKRYSLQAFSKALCWPFDAEGFGLSGLSPGAYFRFLLLGYFERNPSERQIA